MRPRRVLHLAGSQHGMTLIEIQVALVLVAIVAGIAVASVQASLSAARGDSAMAQVTNTFRLARDLAVAQRRTIDVVFQEPNRMRLVRNDLPEGTTEVASVVLENRMQFELEPALPDTPEEFGDAAAIDFDAAETIRFTPDGMVTDADGIPINGTVYMRIPNDPLSDRAVTLTGASARPQPYRWNGKQWQPR